MALCRDRQDQIFYTGAGLLALVVVLFLGMLIAIVGLGLFVPTIKPLGLPQWFWFYRGDPYIMGWLAKGCGIAAALVAGAVIVLRMKKPPLHGEAKWANEQQIARAGLRASEGILLGTKNGRDLCFGGMEHVLLEAPTRAGKGVGVVIPNLLTWPGSVVVLDVKRENWENSAGFRERADQRVLMFDPLDEEGKTARFNPLSYIDRTDETKVINELQKISGMLFPPPAKGDSFWADSARTAFIGVGAYIAFSKDSDGEPLPFTIGEIYRNLSGGDPKAKFTAIAERATQTGSLPQACVLALDDFVNSSENTFKNVRQTLTSRLGLWINPRVDAATAVSDFDLREFRDVRTSLYLGVSPDNIVRVAPIYNLLFQQLIDLNVRSLPTSDKNNVPLLVLLDEFARLGRADTIAAGFSFVAGYGIRLLPVIQSRSQLRAIYGKDMTDEIIANCGVEVVFTPKELEMANEVSARLGTFTYKAKSRSEKFLGNDRSTSTSDQRRALLMPQELMQFPTHELILLRGGFPAVRGKKITYYSDADLSRRSKIAHPEIAAQDLKPRSKRPAPPSAAPASAPAATPAPAPAPGQTTAAAADSLPVQLVLSIEEIEGTASIATVRLDPATVEAVKATSDEKKLLERLDVTMFM